MERNNQGDNYPTMKTLAETQFPSIKDDVNGDGTLVYEGWAPLGTATSAAQWKIRQTTKVGTVTTVMAVNNDEYTSVWDNRTTLAYSR